MMFLPSVYVPQYSLSVARSRQGKVAELRLELNSGGKKDKNNAAKKIALKKIVANMTMSNNDMVALFPDVVGCMSISSLEIKKMFVQGKDPRVEMLTAHRCFLFLVNYARMKPDVALKALPVLEAVRVPPDLSPSSSR
jgi:vesicle coat complex subunit